MPYGSQSGRSTGRPLLVLAALVATVVTLAASATAAGLQPIATEEISSAPEDPGPVPSYHPWGNLSVPAEAVQVRLELDWSVTGVDQADEATISLCASSCHDAHPFAEVTTHPPLTWAVDLPNATDVAWHAEADGQAPRNANVTGTVTYLAPASDAAGSTESSAPAAPATPASVEQDPTTIEILLGAGVLSALAALAYAVRRWLPGGLVGLFSRIPDDELLENETRKRIYELVDRSPGIHFSEIARRLDLSHGRLEHHLGKMLDARLVAETRSGQHRCFVLPGQLEPDVARTLAEVKAPGARRVLGAIVDGAATIQDVAERADVAPSTASYHVSRLADEALLATDKRGREVRVEATDLGRQVEALLEST